MEMIRKIKEKLAEAFGKNQENDSSYVCASVMEKLTNRLIEETVGQNGMITNTFREKIDGYDPEENPISSQEARKLIDSLLRKAVSQRKTLTDRIATSAEIGDLYERYYGKIDYVSTSAIDAYIKMQKMEKIRADYEYYYEMMLNVREKAYLEDVRPGSKGKMPKRYQDIFVAIEAEEEQ